MLPSDSQDMFRRSVSDIIILLPLLLFSSNRRRATSYIFRMELELYMYVLSCLTYRAPLTWRGPLIEIKSNTGRHIYTKYEPAYFGHEYKGILNAGLYICVSRVSHE